MLMVILTRVPVTKVKRHTRLGANDFSSDNDFVWLSGVPVSDAQWAAGTNANKHFLSQFQTGQNVIKLFTAVIYKCF